MGYRNAGTDRIFLNPCIGIADYYQPGGADITDCRNNFSGREPFTYRSCRPLTGLAAGWAAVQLLRFLDRDGKGLRTAPRDAFIATAAGPAQRGRAFGFHRSMDHAGSVIGPLLACGLLFIGARGRVAQKSPIRAGTAYFTNYASINQLGLNPTFTFIRSALDARLPENQRLELMDEDEAQRKAREFLNIPEGTGFDAPLARRVTATGEPLPANVILVIMESMAAAKTFHGNAPEARLSLMRRGLARQTLNTRTKTPKTSHHHVS